MTTVADGLFQYGGMPVGMPPYTGNWYWVDPVHGSDGNSGRSPAQLDERSNWVGGSWI